MNRRHLLSLILASATFPLGAREPLRIGLTPVILLDSRRILNDWMSYLGERLGRPVELVVRQSYEEITRLLQTESLDVGWICGLPYVRNKSSLHLLVTPLFENRPLYRSYLIVPASDHRTRGLADLSGSVFAYVSTDSNSGWLVPRARLRALGLNGDTFFRKTFFAGDHRDVVDAVSIGLADAGAVDGYIWETLRRFHPETTRNTRVAAKSAEYGFPPIVSRASLPTDDASHLRQVLVGMARDPGGRALLDALNLTGFAPGCAKLYQGIEDILRLVLGE
jgi:phosphonate transport system substrate-binding protein